MPALVAVAWVMCLCASIAPLTTTTAASSSKRASRRRRPANTSLVAAANASLTNFSTSDGTFVPPQYRFDVVTLNGADFPATPRVRIDQVQQGGGWWVRVLCAAAC